jgi:pimeloyl-ACP methyl ester carboxylesterase
MTVPAIGAGFARVGNHLLGPSMMAQGLRKAFSPNPVPDDFAIRREPLWLSVKSSLAIAHEVVNYASDLRLMSYDNLASPFHMLYAEQDRSVPLRNARLIIEKNDQVTLRTFPDTGHMIQFIHPEAVISAVDALADEINASASANGSAF